MTFNLKKAQTINDQSSLDSYVQMLITQLNQSGSLPTEDALSQITNMEALSRYGVESFTQLQDIIQQQQEVIEQQENMQNQMVSPPQEAGQPLFITPTTGKGKNKMIKPFNLKKAEFGQPMEAPVMDAPAPAPTPTIEPAPTTEPAPATEPALQQFQFKDGKAVQMWMQNEPEKEKVKQIITENVDNDRADLAKTMVEQFYDMLDDPATESRNVELAAGEIFDVLPASMKEDIGIQAVRKEFNTINDIIKKIAKKTVKKSNAKPFNLTKTAQHKSLDNAILYGPQETRKVDPFLRQPVSDWHIVERNKGFGLVVDDVWNIDYETIWRENIMDKFSRPYKDDDGNWVGGYLHKRFEMDKNIPETNNYQLKPGQIRRPVLPEYGNTESRLQDARSKGNIAGANNTSKPFNWKEASKKKS
jgi:hypothetical protein